MRLCVDCSDSKATVVKHLNDCVSSSVDAGVRSGDSSEPDGQHGYGGAETGSEPRRSCQVGLRSALIAVSLVILHSRSDSSECERKRTQARLTAAGSLHLFSSWLRLARGSRVPPPVRFSWLFLSLFLLYCLWIPPSECCSLKRRTKCV